MQRPGPLQELPLERFLPSNPNTQPAAVKPIRSNKRPLSPGGPSLFSPTKRRILNDEGVYSPDKTCKIPLPSLSTSLSSPARFSHVLAGPASPARVLDFGLPQNIHGDPQKPPFTRSSPVEIIPAEFSTHLASSPELKARKSKSTQRLSSAGRPLDLDSHGYEQDVFSTGSSAASASEFPQFIARELPPQLDPDSVHYPGFRVFQDPYITVFPTTEEDFGSAYSVEADTQKENLPPRRKQRKFVSDLKPVQDLSHCGTTTPKKGNETPKSREFWGSAELSSTIARNMFRISTPSTTSRQGQKSPLQMMKDEMDVVDDDENSSDE